MTQTEEGAPGAEPSPSGRAALVIDDSVEFCGFVEGVLRLHGLQVTAATDGASGIARAQESAPAVIVLDLMLPIVNGFEVCTVLRHDPRTQHIPIIIVTGVANPANVAEAYLRGADMILAKPFTGDALVACVLRALALGRTV